MVKVFIYDDMKALRRDAREHAIEAGNYREGDFKECYGVSHRFERVRVDNDESDPHVSLIRLHKNFLRSGIIAHEVVHSALWIYELDNGKGPSMEDIEKEEEFCYIVGDLNARIINKLYEYKLL